MNKIIQGFPIPPKDHYKVYVNTITYNQSAYIEDCLNGVALQATGFPFIQLVTDDCSTDEEQVIIKRWMDRMCDMENAELYENEICCITIARNKSNPNCTLAAYLLKKNMHGNPLKRNLWKPWVQECPYIAVCEGDDYWIDPYKLQNQVDFMDSHPTYSLCFTGATIKYAGNFETKELKSNMSLFSKLENRDYSGEEILSNWIVPTASVLYRSTINIKNNENFMFGDIVLFLSCANEGTIRCISDKTVVYRRNNNGVSSSTARVEQYVNHYLAIEEVFGQKYSKICRRHICTNLASAILTGTHETDLCESVRILRQNPRYIPWVISYSINICWKGALNRIGRLFKKNN